MQQSPTRKLQEPLVLAPLAKKHKKPMKGLPITGMKLNILTRFANSQSLKGRISSIYDEPNQTMNYPLLGRGISQAKTEHSRSMSKYHSILENKQEKILDRVLKRQNKRYRKNPSPDRLKESYSLKRGSADYSFISMNEQTKKPTDKYFFQLENIRLAERILLAKPSNDISKRSARKFYQEHEQLKKNISRLGSISRLGEREKGSKQTQKQKRHRQKWCDD